MQIWKWLLVLGLIFLISYNPSRGGGSKLVNYFTSDTIGGNVFPGESRGNTAFEGTAQKYSNSGDDDR